MVDQSTATQEGNHSLFPHRLYEMLVECEKQGLDHVVSWLPDGKAFKVHQVPEFVETILPKYFRQSKYKSYQRQLNLWGFERVTSNGPEKGAYYHNLFLKGQASMCKLLTRQRGNKCDIVVETPPKQAKPKSPRPSRKVSITSLVTNNVKNQSPPPKNQSAAARTTCLKPQHDMILPLIDQITVDAAEAIVGSFSPTSTTNFDDSEFLKADDDELILFEGCQFFPLEERSYDELENIVLRAGTDLLAWHPLEKDTSTAAPSRTFSFGMHPTSSLCTV